MFLYTLVTNDSMSFPLLFIRSLVEVHRSSSSSHAIFFPVFIHRILLHLGLEDFPASEPIHIVALIGATFLWQRLAQMRASSKCPRVESSGATPPLPFSIGDTSTKASIDLTTAAVPPSFTSDDSSIRRMLETVITVQAAHGQLLVDMLDELWSSRANLESLRRSPPPSPFDDQL